MILPLLLALAQAANPCPGLPLAPGTSWTYRAAVAWTDSGDTLTHRDSIVWHTEAIARRPRDSIVVATVRGWPSELAWWTPGQLPERSLLLCVSGRVYHLTPDTLALDRVTDSLLRGQRVPGPDDLILRLPLHSGMLFGRDPPERSDRMYAWDVQDVSAVPGALGPWAQGATDSLFTLAYLTLPDEQEVKFVPGIGVVGYAYTHHGTIAEAEARLTGFHAGAPR